MSGVRAKQVYPQIIPFQQPRHIRDYPQGPGCASGRLVEGHAGWRTFRPIVDRNQCTACWQCYLLCPDAAVYKSEGKAAINTDFCKGCGICAAACPTKAIEMIKEADYER